MLVSYTNTIRRRMKFNENTIRILNTQLIQIIIELNIPTKEKFWNLVFGFKIVEC